MKILVLEDNERLANLIVEALEQKKYHATLFTDGKKALKAIDNGFDCFILDINVPGMDGISLLKEIRTMDAHTPAIIISANIDLDTIQDKASVMEAFFTYAQNKQRAEAQALIAEENLNEEEAKRYITASLKREYASENGTELNALLPKMSPLNPQYLTKKQNVFQKLILFVEKFKGVGGKL